MSELKLGSTVPKVDASKKEEENIINVEKKDTIYL